MFRKLISAGALVVALGLLAACGASRDAAPSEHVNDHAKAPVQLAGIHWSSGD